ncbi:MAG: permease [Methylacidiphilales bacterium]|nr:permease [Candidatus Methylacidiphilales bacterium]MDW8349345.1 permease [Verrucomicrobiae bacterium]
MLLYYLQALIKIQKHHHTHPPTTPRHNFIHSHYEFLMQLPAPPSTISLTLMDDPFFGSTQTLWFTLSFPDFLLSFLALTLESAPFLLLGALISSAIETYVPLDAFTHRLRGSKTKSIAIALLFAFLFPVCECSAVPIAAMLLRRGVPPVGALTYLLASPLINPLALLSTLIAFYGQSPLIIALWRVGLGLLTLLLTILILTYRRSHFLNLNLLLTTHNQPPPACQTLLLSLTRPAADPRLPRFLALTAHSFIAVLPYLILGCVLASLFNTGINRETAQHALTHPLFAPLGSILLAQLLCLCSTTDAFIIVAFFSLSLPAKLAFLIAGPLIDIRLFILYRSLFTTRFVTLLWLTLTLLTWILILIFSPLITT